MATSTAASAVSVTAISALFIFYDAADCKTNDSQYDGTYDNCSHTILLSDLH